LSTYKEFKFRYAYDLASMICQEIYENQNSMNPEEYFTSYDVIDQEFLKKISQPLKNTLLHQYILYTWDFILGYIRDKTGSEEAGEFYQNILDTYEIDYPVQGRKSHEKYCDLLEHLLVPINKRIIEETFTILFNNRSLLLEFNTQVSSLIETMKKNDYPNVMEKDGVVKRCSYLPVWLKNAIWFRDKGRCQGCGKDLTGLVSVRGEDQIHHDHINPLEHGGTNDPTNFQLLCNDCNLKKSYVQIYTSDLHQTFW
jgi:hypothetical protein